ncbi:Serine/threonine-protein kinase smg1 [Nowakowskiella sp. JEL0407]|nr:Serine/threonine-protein kinase smg1 [Nowakowskiella sp. JEL0407]
MSRRSNPRSRDSASSKSERSNYERSDRYSSSTSESIKSYLSRILRDDQFDTNYSKRIVACNQLNTFLGGLNENELGIATDILLRKNGVELGLEDPQASTSYKQSIVKIISTIGTNLLNTDSFLKWIFTKLSDSVSVESKQYLIFVLKEVLDRPGAPLAKQATVILGQIQFYMEEMEIECLPKILDVLISIADNYPRDFGACFKEIVDLLVGWATDTDVPRSTMTLICDNIKNYWRFWKNEIDFAIELLTHLLTDLESVLEVSCESDLDKTGDLQVEPPKAIFVKRVPSSCLTYYRIFSAVLNSLCMVYSPSINDEITSWGMVEGSAVWKKFIHIVHWILELSAVVGRSFGDKLWVVYGCDVIKLLSKAFGKKIYDVQIRAISLLFVDLDLIVSDELDGKVSGKLSEVNDTQDHSETSNGTLSQENSSDDENSNSIEISKASSTRSIYSKRYPKKSWKNAAEDNHKQIANRVSGWLEKLHEILRFWEGNVNPQILHKFLVPSQSRLIGEIRLRLSKQQHFLDDLRDIIKKISQNLKVFHKYSPTSLELFHEAEELFVCLAEGEDLKLNHEVSKSANDVRFWSDRIRLLKGLDVDSQISLLQFDMEVIAIIAPIIDWDSAMFLTVSLVSMLANEKELVLRRREVAFSCESSKANFWWNEVERTILNSLRVLCCSNQFFVHYATGQEEGKNFTATLSAIMCRSLIYNIVPRECKTIALIWLEAAVRFLADIDSEQSESASTNLSYLWDNTKTSLVTVLELAYFSQDKEFKISVANIWAVFMKSLYKKTKNFTLEPRQFEFIFKQSKASDSEVKTAYLTLLSHLDPIETLNLIRDPSFPRLTNKLELDQNGNWPGVKNISSSFKLSTMMSPHLGTFRPKHFQSCMDIFGIYSESAMTQHLMLPNSDATNALDTMFFVNIQQSSILLERIYHACQSNTILNETPMFGSNPTLSDAVDLTEEMLFFWAAWECSRYCLLTRMRTPFGGPTQTFEAIEHALNMWTQVAETIPKESYKVAQIIATRIYHILMLIQTLEMQIRHAADDGGVALVMPSAPRASVTFFATNRRVCEDWFSRMRTKIVYAASEVVGCDISNGIVLQNGFSGLLQMEKNMKSEGWAVEVEKTIVSLVHSLLNERDPDAIVGLIKWVHNASARFETDGEVGEGINPNLISWMEAAVMCSTERYESVPKYLREKLSEITAAEDGPNYMALYTSLITECYLNLNDWESMSDWLQLLNRMQEDEESRMNDLFAVYTKPQLSSWVEFGREVFDQALLDPDAMESYQLPSLPKIFTGKGVFGNSLRASELLTMQTMAVFGRFADFDPKSEISSVVDSECSTPEEPDFDDTFDLSEKLTELAHDRITNAIQLGSMDSIWSIAPFVIQLQSIWRLSDNLQMFEERNDSESFVHASKNRQINSQGLAPSHHLMHLQKIFRFTRFSEFLDEADGAKVVGESEEQLGQLRIELSKVARSRGCFNTAKKMITETQAIKDLQPSSRLEVLNQQAMFDLSQCRVDFAVKELLRVADDEYNDLSEGLSNVWIKLADCARGIDFASQDDLYGTYLSRLNGMTEGGAHSGKHYLEAFNTVVASGDALFEKCITIATSVNPTGSEAWLAYANFYYEYGKRMLEESSSPSGADTEKTIMFATLDEMSESICDRVGFEKEEMYKTLGALLVEELGDADHSLDLRPRIAAAFPNISEDHLNNVTVKVGQLVDLLTDCFSASSQGYFKFLNLVTTKKRLNSSTLISSALRVLRVLMKYGVRMKELFETNFSNPNTESWELIMPQLFSRLDHPDTFVRQQIINLLCRISQSSPHKAIYQTSVGSMSERIKSKNSASISSYHQILSSIRKVDVEADSLVSQVLKLIVEFQRVTVLWDELWFHKLAYIQNDVQKRLEKLERESERVRTNTTLKNSEKNKILDDTRAYILKPVIHILDKLCNQTIRRDSETPHETTFKKLLSERIELGLSLLKSNTTTPKEAWQKFKAVFKELQKEMQRSRLVSLADVSPYLATLRNTSLPIPGLLHNQEIITIDIIGSTIRVLPTKTKPKKVDLHGSDGKIYSFLFKGQEDLHLDERVMQFLTTANELFNCDDESVTRNLNANAYSVIPFGDNYGMVQWVPNMLELYALYKKWQDRNHTTKLLLKKPEEEIAESAIRPHEHFYVKSMAILKKYKISRSTPRQKWPVHVLREVFEELCSETPSDLISMSLWTSSTSSSVWWNKIQSFARSVAVTSVIGYVIGLGDRHLDNILIDIYSGEVLHIDYNVCFEKGRRLKIPETVPFRLTRNMVAAFGPLSSVDGSFRIACENALRVLRENREVLVTLLETFIYDPLVDWTSDMAEDVERREIELNGYIGLLSSRIAEMRLELSKTAEECVSKLSELTKLGSRLWEVAEEKKSVSLEIKSLRNNVGDASQSTNLAEEIVSVRRDIQERVDNCNYWFSHHQKVLQTLTTPFISTQFQEIINADPLLLFGQLAHLITSITPEESVVHRIFQLDQDFQNLGQMRVSTFQLYFKNLHIFQAVSTPIITQLLERDYFRKWSDILQRLLDSQLNEDDYSKISSARNFDSAYGKVKDLIETSIRTSSDNLETSRELLEKLAIEGESKQSLDSYPKNRAPYNNLNAMRIVAIAGVAEFGKFLYSLQKGNFESTPSKFFPWILESALAGKKLIQIDGTLSPAFILINSLPIFLTKIQDESTDHEMYGESFSDLTNVFIPFANSLVAFSRLCVDCGVVAITKASINNLFMNDLSFSINEIIAILEKSSAANSNEDVKLKAANRYSSFREKYLINSELAPFEMLFVTLENQVALVVKTVEGVNVLPSLILLKMQLLRSLVESNRNYSDKNPELINHDPTKESILGSDLNVLLSDVETFNDLQSSFDSYISVCIKEALIPSALKVMAKIAKKLAQSIAKSNPKAAKASGKSYSEVWSEKTTVPFVDSSRKCVFVQLEQGYITEEQISKVSKALGEHNVAKCSYLITNELAMEISQKEARLQEQKLSLMRFEHLHAASLGSSINSTHAQWLQLAAADHANLRQYSEQLQMLHKDWENFKSEYLTLFASNEVILEHFKSRDAQIASEIQRLNVLIGFSEAISHFESFRTINDKTQAMDEDTIKLVENLRRLTTQKRESDDAHAQMEIMKSCLKKLEREERDTKSRMVKYAKTASQTFFALKSRLDEVFSYVETIMKESDGLENATSVKSTIQSFVGEWKRLNHQFKELKQDEKQISFEDVDWDLLLQNAGSTFAQLLGLLSLKQLECKSELQTDDDQEENNLAQQIDEFSSSAPSQFELGQHRDLNMDVLLSDEYLSQSDDKKKSHVPIEKETPEAVEKRDNVKRRAVQERNQHAVNLLKRVKTKLEGRDTADYGKLTVSEQVENIISEAVKVENFAMMYEGWMAWI